MAAPVKQAMPQYQSRDNEVVDYELFELPGFPYMLRGPQPAPGKEYVSVVGAGQSFGVLVRNPYTHQLHAELGTEIFNLSVGGSAPTLYLRNPEALEVCNNSKVCIVQVLSARSTVSSYFESDGGKNMLRPQGSKLPFVPGDTAFTMMFQSEPSMVSRLVVKEIQSNWVKEMSTLLRSITVPKILLWFSKRKPEQLRSEFKNYREASGVFPQFVNREMIDEIVPFADAYVEVASNRGSPQPLTSRFTGEPVTVLLGDGGRPSGENSYYPSPEMHDDAFNALKETLHAFL